jgi:hypothetical protein
LRDIANSFEGHGPMKNPPITIANVFASVRTPLQGQEKTNLFLLPGELVARKLNVTDPESKMLLRLFVNLTVYGKVAVILLMIAMGIG